MGHVLLVVVVGGSRRWGDVVLCLVVGGWIVQQRRVVMATGFVAVDGSVSLGASPVIQVAGLLFDTFWVVEWFGSFLGCRRRLQEAVVAVEVAARGAVGL